MSWTQLPACALQTKPLLPPPPWRGAWGSCGHACRIRDEAGATPHLVQGSGDSSQAGPVLFFLRSFPCYFSRQERAGVQSNASSRCECKAGARGRRGGRSRELNLVLGAQLVGCIVPISVPTQTRRHRGRTAGPSAPELRSYPSPTRTAFRCPWTGVGGQNALETIPFLQA